MQDSRLPGIWFDTPDIQYIINAAIWWFSKEQLSKQPYNMHCMNKKVVFTGQVQVTCRRTLFCFGFYEYEPCDILISENNTSDIKTWMFGF